MLTLKSGSVRSAERQPYSPLIVQVASNHHLLSAIKPRHVVYPVRDKGHGFLESVSFVLLLNANPQRLITASVLTDKVLQLQSRILFRLRHYWADAPEDIRDSVQKMLLEGAAVGLLASAAALLLLRQETGQIFTVHAADCTCTGNKPQIWQAGNHVVFSGGCFAAVCSVEADKQQLYAPAVQHIGHHGVHCSSCLVRCLICRRMLSSDDRDHRSHVYPSAEIDRLEAAFNMRHGQAISTHDMSFRSLCFIRQADGRLGCDPMLSHNGEHIYLQFSATVRAAAESGFTAPVTASASDTRHIHHAACSILLRVMVRSQLAAADACYCYWLDRLREYILSPERFPVDPDFLKVAVHVPVESELQQWESKYHCRSLINVTYESEICCSVPPSSMICHMAYVGPLQLFIYIGVNAASMALMPGLLPIHLGTVFTIPADAERDPCLQSYQDLDYKMPGLIDEARRARPLDPAAAVQSNVILNVPRKCLIPGWLSQQQHLQPPGFECVATKRQDDMRVHIMKPIGQQRIRLSVFLVVAFHEPSPPALGIEMCLEARCHDDKLQMLSWHPKVRTYAESEGQSMVKKNVIFHLVEKACQGKRSSTYHFLPF